MGDEKGKTQHLVTARDFHDRPTRIRFWLSQGHELVLSRRGKVFGYIRPYVAEKDESFDTPEAKKVQSARIFMTLDDIRTNMDDFAFGLEVGNEYIISHYGKKMGVATEKVPAKLQKALEKEIEEVGSKMRDGAFKAWETKRSKKE